MNKHAHDIPCHEGIICVAKGAQAALYGAGLARLGPNWLADWPEPDIILGPDSLRFPVPRVTIRGPLANRLPSSPPGPTVIAIPWPDFEPPTLPSSWWKRLATALENLAAELERPIRVLCFCQGGHGRTGTALAILGGLLGLFEGPTAGHIIDSLRAAYCPQAVESYVQAQYIAETLGLPLGDFEPPVKTTIIARGDTLWQC